MLTAVIWPGESASFKVVSFDYQTLVARLFERPSQTVSYYSWFLHQNPARTSFGLKFPDGFFFHECAGSIARSFFRRCGQIFMKICRCTGKIVAPCRSKRENSFSTWNFRVDQHCPSQKNNGNLVRFSSFVDLPQLSEKTSKFSPSNVEIPGRIWSQTRKWRNGREDAGTSSAEIVQGCFWSNSFDSNNVVAEAARRCELADRRIKQSNC